MQIIGSLFKIKYPSNIYDTIKYLTEKVKTASNDNKITIYNCSTIIN